MGRAQLRPHAPHHATVRDSKGTGSSIWTVLLSLQGWMPGQKNHRAGRRPCQSPGPAQHLQEQPPGRPPAECTWPPFPCLLPECAVSGCCLLFQGSRLLSRVGAHGRGLRPADLTLVATVDVFRPSVLALPGPTVFKDHRSPPGHPHLLPLSASPTVGMEGGGHSPSGGVRW